MRLPARIRFNDRHFPARHQSPHVLDTLEIAPRQRERVRDRLLQIRVEHDQRHRRGDQMNLSHPRFICKQISAIGRLSDQEEPERGRLQVFPVGFFSAQNILGLIAQLSVLAGFRTAPHLLVDISVKQDLIRLRIPVRIGGHHTCPQMDLPFAQTLSGVHMSVGKSVRSPEHLQKDRKKLEGFHFVHHVFRLRGLFRSRFVLFRGHFLFFFFLFFIFFSLLFSSFSESFSELFPALLCLHRPLFPADLEASPLISAHKQLCGHFSCRVGRHISVDLLPDCSPPVVTGVPCFRNLYIRDLHRSPVLGAQERNC